MLATHTLRARLGDLSRALTGGPVRPGEAPLVRAPLPFLGHALAVGRDLRALLRDCQRAHGDVFTLLVAGQRMTFVLDPFSYPHVLKAQGDLSFHELGEQFGQRAFGFESLPPGPDVDALYAAFSTHLKGAALTPLSERMESRLRAVFARAAGPAWRDESLYMFTARSIFTAGQEVLFGDGAGDEACLADFLRLDRWFTALAAGIPIAALPGVRRALHGLVDRVGVLRPDMSPFIRARVDALDRMTPPRNRDHHEVAILWAAQANTLPAAFWSLAYLLRHPVARAEVTAEVRERGLGDLKQLVKLQSSVSEALRLSSGALTLRLALRDCHLTLESGQTFALRAGDRVALCPNVTHYDPDIFADPEAYRFDRFLADGGPRQFFKRGKRVPIPLMPYGGGVSMCPGRFLANNEVMQFVALALTELDLELLGPALPPFDNARAGLGVLPPKGDVRCRLRRRG